MSHSQFHCSSRLDLDMHGLDFETSICYWQDQPGSMDVYTLHAPTGQTERGTPHARAKNVDLWGVLDPWGSLAFTSPRTVPSVRVAAGDYFERHRPARGAGCKRETQEFSFVSLSPLDFVTAAGQANLPELRLKRSHVAPFACSPKS